MKDGIDLSGAFRGEVTLWGSLKDWMVLTTESPLISGWETNATVKYWELRSRKLWSSRECQDQSVFTGQAIAAVPRNWHVLVRIC